MLRLPRQLVFSDPLFDAGNGVGLLRQGDLQGVVGYAGCLQFVAGAEVDIGQDLQFAQTAVTRRLVVHSRRARLR